MKRNSGKAAIKRHKLTKEFVEVKSDNGKVSTVYILDEHKRKVVDKKRYPNVRGVSYVTKVCSNNNLEKI